MADLKKTQVTLTNRYKLGYTGGHAGVEGAPKLTRAIQDMDNILSRRFGAGGSIAERALTWGDLASAGVINLIVNGRKHAGSPGETPFAEPIPQPSRPERPHQPTGFVGYGAQTTIILTWNATSYAGHGFTEVYKSASSVFGGAVLAGRSNSRVFADRVGAAATFYYWIRHVNELGEAGSFTEVGLQVTSGTASPGDTQIANDLLVVDKGIIVEALIGDAEIGGAKIRDASIESAKIISLAANKITAGAIQVNQYIQSAGYISGVAGWHIHGNGAAEFRDLTVRANIVAGSTITAPVITGGTVNAATINGSTINAGTINASNMNGSQIRGSFFGSIDSGKWLAFDGHAGYILFTQNAKITTAGATEFSNAIGNGTWTTGLAAGSLQWVRDDPGPGNDWIGA